MNGDRHHSLDEFLQKTGMTLSKRTTSVIQRNDNFSCARVVQPCLQVYLILMFH
jgi:transposase